MTPDETNTDPLDEHLLARVIACDALLHADSDHSDRPSQPPRSDDEADDRARSRLLLLLRLLDAVDATSSDAGVDARDRPHSAPGEGHTLLGRFEILEDLGAGGFGFVVRARDRLLGREVALKMPLPERMLGPGDVRRFLREAQAAARLDHPHIVRVFDAGELGPLGYFIAAEFAAGPSLRQWLKAQTQPVSARMAAAWAAALADAAQHAHDRGILHRDIKPDNVIMAQAPPPDLLVPRLTDFGLAKVLEEAGDDTRSGARVGTPHYMAPEQAAGNLRDIGPATDIYALGATLYEVLTGRPPFRGENEAETLRLVLDAEPVPPRSLRPGLPRDLETICLKCLRKEPARRYTTAADLRDDLRRFLDGRPIVGRPVSTRERAWRSARRRPAVAALVAVVILLACGLIGGFAWWASWLEWHNQQLEIHVARADREAREAERQTRIAEERRRLSDRHHHAEGLRRARQALDARQIELAQDILHDLRPEPGSDDSRGFPWRYLWRRAHRDFSQLWGHGATVMGIVLSRDGRTLVTWDLQGKHLAWDLTPGMDLDRPREFPVPNLPDLDLVEISPDGRYLARILSWGLHPTIDLVETASGRHIVRVPLPGNGQVHVARFDPGSRRLAVVRSDGHGMQFIDVSDTPADSGNEPHRSIASVTFSQMAASPDGRLFALQQGDRIRLHDPWTGAERVVLEGSQPGAIGPSAFSADGRFFATSVPGDRVRIWETDSGREVDRFESLANNHKIVLSPKGARVAVMDNSGFVTVLDRPGRRRDVLASGPRREIRGRAMSFSSDEALLAISVWTEPGGNQAPEVWDVAAPRRLQVAPGRQVLGDVAFLPGGHSLIVMGGTTPRIWRLDAPGEPDALEGHKAEAWATAFAADGKVLATGSDDTREPRTIRLWDPATGRPLAGWKGHTATVVALAFSPDGRILASGSLDSGKPGKPNVILWDVASQRRLSSLEGHTARVRSVVFSPDGKTLATTSDDLTCRLWDAAARTTRAVLSGHTRNVTCIAFSPDGQTLATGSNDATVRTWDVATGRSLTTLSDKGNVLAVAYAPDGSLLASANEDGGIKLWDPATGALVRQISSEADQLRCLAFTPDGHNVVAAGKGKVIRVWDVVTGQELLTLEGHKAQVNALAFSPDGSTLASCGHDGAVKLWRAGPIEAVP